MKKAFLLLPILFVLLTASSRADQLNMTSYYPAPSGTYQNIFFTPQSTVPLSNCQIGSIFANSNDNSKLYYCSTVSGSPEFAPFPGPWTLNGTELYLTDSSNPLNKKIGIGTVTPSFKLTLANDGGILADNYYVPAANSTIPGATVSGAMLIWHPYLNGFRVGNFTNLNLNGLSDGGFGEYSLAMGHENIAASTGTAVWGGSTNSAGVQPMAGPALILGYEVIVGGKSNSAGLHHAQIIGGESNTAKAYSAVGGKSNSATGDYSIVLGGEGNSIPGGLSVITGGSTNSNGGLASTIAGGFTNTTNADYSTISGGNSNDININSSYSTISGGDDNSITFSTFGFIGGGYANVIQSSANYSTIGGGYLNTLSGAYASLSSGYGSANTGVYSSNIGGWINIALGPYSAIVGGSENSVDGQYSMAVGDTHVVEGDFSLGLGQCARIAPAADRTLTWGHCISIVPQSTIMTPDAFIIRDSNLGVRDINPGALVEINSSGSSDDYLNLTSTAAAANGNIFTIKNSGNIGVGVTAPTQPLIFANGAYVSATGNFVNASSRNYKTNISKLSTDEAMQALSKLEPVFYKYKSEPAHEYIGFIAEDVPELVATQDRAGLSAMDLTAVLTQVISHQQDVLTQQKEEAKKLLKEIDLLKNKLKTKNRQP